MKKEKQIGVRVGLPVFFALEVEDVYRHTSGAHRALAFPDFLGLLIGLGLEAYRKQSRQEEDPRERPGELRDYNEAIEPGLRLVRTAPETNAAGRRAKSHDHRS
jgi:hypothetical protein